VFVGKSARITEATRDIIAPTLLHTICTVQYIHMYHYPPDTQISQQRNSRSPHIPKQARRHFKTLQPNQTSIQKKEPQKVGTPVVPIFALYKPLRGLYTEPVQASRAGLATNRRERGQDLHRPVKSEHTTRCASGWAPGKARALRLEDERSAASPPTSSPSGATP
jgi:hypothetical protein